MSSVAHFSDRRVVAWRIPDFDRRLAAATPGDQWAGDLYECRNSDNERFLLLFRLVPKDEQGACSLYVGAAEPSVAAKCEAWLEKIDGTASEHKTIDCVLKRDLDSVLTLCTETEMRAFRHTPTVFVCLRLPFHATNIGTPLPLPTVHRWSIRDFAESFDSAAFGDEWRGVDFAVTGVDETSFCLVFHPKYEHEDAREHAAVFLEQCRRSCVPVQFDLWFEHPNGKRTQKWAFNYDYSGEESWGEARMIGHEEHRAFSNGSALTLCCEVRPLGSPVEISALEIAGILAARSFDDPQRSDFKVLVGDRTFHVHRSILCAHSSVLTTNLTSGLKEATEGELTINHELFHAHVVERMLRFVYTGEVEELDAWATRLLPIADYYQVDRLHVACINSMIVNRSVEHTMEHLLLAFRHDHDGDFKKLVVRFAHENRKRLFRMDGWRKFGLEHPHIPMAMLKS